MTDSKAIAIVTGASRGIGKAIAVQLAEDGFFVVGTATTDSGAEAISAYLADNGKGMALDVSQAAEVEAFVKGVSKEIGVPVVLVNNAGITRDNLLMRLKEDDWDAIINTNLSSV